MKNCFKVGFGLTIGALFAVDVVALIHGGIKHMLAKDEKTMEREKERDPEFYKELKRFQ